tara:strand:- start:191 stop:478 length:288 start_codon:yes stop_codon:yes gene_type:complete
VVDLELLSHQELLDLEDQVVVVVEIVEELHLKQAEQVIVHQLVLLKEIQEVMEQPLDHYMLEVAVVEHQHQVEQVEVVRQEQVEQDRQTVFQGHL